MSWDEPATGRQKLAVARLCAALGIREELEQEAMTRLEARRLIYELRSELKGGETDERPETCPGVSGDTRRGDPT